MGKSAPRRVVPPRPRATLAQAKLPLFDPPRTWYRLVARGHDATPLFWNRDGVYRFDSPGAKWGVCYAASSVAAAFQEVWGDVLRQNPRLVWSELAAYRVWRISVPGSFRAIELAGETLGVIHATLQCFTGSYPRSQEWGAALMNHPDALDGVVYLGRRCGRNCLAMFGDAAKPRPFQSKLRVERMGDLVRWNEFWPLLDRLKVKVVGLPPADEIALEGGWGMSNDQ